MLEEGQQSQSLKTPLCHAESARAVSDAHHSRHVAYECFDARPVMLRQRCSAATSRVIYADPPTGTRKADAQRRKDSAQRIFHSRRRYGQVPTRATRSRERRADVPQQRRGDAVRTRRSVPLCWQSGVMLVDLSSRACPLCASTRAFFDAPRYHY